MTVRRRVRAATLALALLVAGTLPVAAQDLSAALQRVASSWHRGDAGSIIALAAEGGISLDVDGGSVGPLAGRQAAAVLRRVFDDRESVTAAPRMSRTVGGSPARGFGEITWTTRVRGTTIPERATLFVAFVRERDAWRVTEIRLMR